MPLLRRSLIAAVAAVLTVPPAAAAQQGPADGKATVHELTLEKHLDISNGKIAMVEGDAGPEGVRFVVNKLDILQPVAVTLATVDDPGADLRLSLWKYAEDTVQRDGSTRGAGVVSFQFRTEDDVQIRVVSPDGPKRYRLAVWAGDPVEIPVPSPFVSQAGFTGGSGTSPLMYVIAAGVVLIAIFMGVIAMRRKKA